MHSLKFEIKTTENFFLLKYDFLVSNHKNKIVLYKFVPNRVV